MKNYSLPGGEHAWYAGFMGVDNGKIEMLFISHEPFGKSIGKLLAAYSVNNLGLNLVDVNEQNEHALVFYEHLGFIVYGRLEFDEQGNPFLILHMKFSCENKTK